MRILVTGATGLLGNTIVRELAEQSYTPIALVRQTPDPEVFEGIKTESGSVETVHAEFTPAEQHDDGSLEKSSAGYLEQVIESCDAVIHCAAMIHLGWQKMDESMRVNRDGTRRIANACLKYQKKLLFIGTVNSIALGSPNTEADENTPLGHAGGQIPCAYVASKKAALAEVERAVASGLNATVLHPGFMLGPWDWKPSSGRMLLELGKGWKAVAPRGGCSVCDSRDVAKGVVAAIDYRCEPGRQFILAGHNWTYRQLWTEMAKRMGSRPPVQTLGPGVEYLAGAVGDLWTKISGRETDVNSAQVAMSGQFHWYDSGRAIRELNYNIRDADETLDTAAQWIRDRFVLSPTADNR
ncbi:NAD-dependent epimerase/dehydratase family protein [Rhodopirellula sp. MGV]|uniref:NAD-dependent epimerase/dehydratase family protein n=1 Tax=Rhodopirellula sp. MGV TaxID=2023130 RepID=UPI000B9610C1|nr:NAD-dependent epimerase/dehydratase family protein [Rhodopirellula sp. MGV]OYP38394.1 HpnA protein [Rhodopirellula sp. MGV]PNY34222.1 HpnA protein [Rhodopirellula baltica]